MRKFIVFILIILILGVAAGESYLVYQYLLTKHNKQNQTVNVEPVEEKQELTLSEKEINKYLEYVPLTNTYENDAYSGNETNLKTIKQEILMEKAFLASETVETEEEVEHPLCGEEKCAVDTYVLISELNNNIKSMYNINESDIKTEKFNVPGGIVVKYGRYGEDSNSLEKVNKIIEYKEVENELTIKEQVGFVEDGADGVAIYKLNANTSKLDYNPTSVDDAKEYIKENVKEFNTFTHTFKKQDNSYYWYSTSIEK